MEWYRSEASQAEKIHTNIFVGLLSACVPTVFVDGHSGFVSPGEHIGAVIFGTVFLAVLWCWLFPVKYPKKNWIKYPPVIFALSGIFFMHVMMTIPMGLTYFFGKIDTHKFTIESKSSGSSAKGCANYVRFKEQSHFFTSKVCTSEREWASVKAGLTVESKIKTSPFGIWVIDLKPSQADPLLIVGVAGSLTP